MTATLKTCLVTGASSGIGLATSIALARQGAQVAMVCRPSRHMEAAVNEVRRIGGDPIVISADLSRVDDVEQAASEIVRVCPRLDVVVHNAGIWPMQRRLTGDGFEQAFAVNHLAPFVLNRRLLPHLAQAPRARIVQVTAGLYAKGRVDLRATPTGNDFHRLRTYANTKLWNLLATLHLARQCEGGSVVTVNVVHPGVVRTRLGASKSVIGCALWLVKRLWLTPAAGARGPTHLALSDAVADTNGALYNQMAPMALAAVARDEQLAQQVVAETERLVAGFARGEATAIGRHG